MAQKYLPESTVRPWERQLGEGEQAWIAFQAYLNLPPPRRYEDAAKAVNKTIDNIKQYGTKNHWIRRVQLYDSFMFGGTLEQTQKALVEASTAARGLLMKQEFDDYTLELEAWQKKFDEIVNSSESTSADFIRMLRARDIIDQFGRRALRLPAHYSQMEVPLADDEDLEDDVHMISWDGPIEG